MYVLWNMDVSEQPSKHAVNLKFNVHLSFWKSAQKLAGFKKFKVSIVEKL